jgi:hypothetical protein
VSGKGKVEGGEKQGYREAMDKLAGRMVRQGMHPNEARKRARDSALRTHYRQDKKR